MARSEARTQKRGPEDLTGRSHRRSLPGGIRYRDGLQWPAAERAGRVKKPVIQTGEGQHHVGANRCRQYQLYMGPLAP